MIQIYKIIYSKRKTLCIEISRDGKLIIRSPRTISKEKIQGFVNQKKAWINLKLQQKKNHILKAKKFLEKNNSDISKQSAYKIISPEVKRLSSTFNFKYATIKVTNAKTRWGSCSHKNNLNFTEKIALLPKEIMQYIIIHELAHTEEKNHGKKFWKIIKNIIPDYKIKIKWLKEHQNILNSDL